MSIKYYAYLQFEDIFLDGDQRSRVLGNPTVDKSDPLNADRMFVNREMVKLIRRFSDRIVFTVFYQFTKQPVVNRFFNNAGLKQSASFRITYLGNDFYSRIVSKDIGGTEDTHALFFICKDKTLDTIRFPEDMQERISKRRTILFYHILPAFFGTFWSVFAAHSEKYCSHFYRAALFSESVTGLSNFLAFQLRLPEKSVWQYKRFLSREEGSSSRNFRSNPNERLFLFDYFSTAKDNLLKDRFSEFLVKHIKDSDEANEVTRFFVNSAVRHLSESGADLKKCLFLVYPSSEAGRWNMSILNAAQEILRQFGLRTDHLKSLRRTCTVPRLHDTGIRDIGSQAGSIHLDLDPMDLKEYEYAVMLDDLTSRGTTYDAFKKIMKSSGFGGVCRAYAVAGTKYSNTKSLEFKVPVNYSRRDYAPYGYIFDLDDTLIGSDNAAEFRQKGLWKSAYEQIPGMKQFYCVVDALKRLVRKGIDVAVVTSSPAEYCYRILRYLGISLNDIVCVCYHDTEKHKPDAEPYLAAERQMKHNNGHIFCVGDQLSDVKACDNANLCDPLRIYIPILAQWNSGWFVSKAYDPVEEKMFSSELQFVRFLGFILPAYSTLDDLIDRYMRPAFTDISYSNVEIYAKLAEEGYLSRTNAGNYIPTAKGSEIGLMDSAVQRHILCRKRQIVCNYQAQFEIINIFNHW